MNVDAWSKTDIGLVRKSNQDAVGCFPELSLFIVADGLGGHADGEVASKMAVDLLRDFFNDDDDAGEAAPATGPIEWLRRLFARGGGSDSNGQQQTLTSVVKDVNRRIHETGRANAAHGNTRTLGTTVVVLRLDGDSAYWAHVGDSRLYRLRDGELQLLTADHTEYGEPFRTERRIPTDIRHTNKLLQALGVRFDVEVATGSDTVREGDVFLLCSDGVSGLIAPAAIREQLQAPTMEAAGRSLIQLALDAGGRDNASVVTVKVGAAADAITRSVPAP